MLEFTSNQEAGNVCHVNGCLLQYDVFKCMIHSCFFIKPTCSKGSLWARRFGFAVVEFVIQHHRNAAQLAPVVRADTAGFHSHGEEGGQGVLLPSHIWPRGCAIARASDKWLWAGTTKRYTWQLPEQTEAIYWAFVVTVVLWGSPKTMQCFRNVSCHLLYLVNI